MTKYLAVLHGKGTLEFEGKRLKRKSWLMWLALVIGFLIIPVTDNAERLSSELRQHIEPLVAKLVALSPTTTTSKKTDKQTNDESAIATDKTPMESNVQGVTLSRTYYYHFASGTPQAVKTVFEEAIKTYNQTGVVKLVRGTGTAKQNQIKFSFYRKVMAAPQQGTIELGRGGPDIIIQTGLDHYVANHALASMNITYPGLIKRSVAIHELGHALGLAHSTSQRSVMYPVDRGRTQLTNEDINGLKAVYNQ